MPRNHNNRNYMKTYHRSGWKSSCPESLICYGDPVKEIPARGEGCQYWVEGSGFCNGDPINAYCENHAKICGGIYRR